MRRGLEGRHGKVERKVLASYISQMRSVVMYIMTLINRMIVRLRKHIIQ